VEESILRKENVILDTTGLSATDIETLRWAVEEQSGLRAHVIWWP
jgi:hypothetical protein